MNLNPAGDKKKKGTKRVRVLRSAALRGPYGGRSGAKKLVAYTFILSKAKGHVVEDISS